MIGIVALWQLVDVHRFLRSVSLGISFPQAVMQKFWGSFVDLSFLPSDILNALLSMLHRFSFVYRNGTNWPVPVLIMIIDTNCHWIEIPVQFRNPIHQSKQLQLREFRWKTKLFLAWKFPTQRTDSKSCDRPKINVWQMSPGDSFGCVIFQNLSDNGAKMQPRQNTAIPPWQFINMDFGESTCSLVG